MNDVSRMIDEDIEEYTELCEFFGHKRRGYAPLSIDYNHFAELKNMMRDHKRKSRIMFKD